MLVTGVTGFIGSHLARALTARGDEVHALVRPGARVERIPDLVDRIEMHTDDGTAAGMARVVDAAAPDVTFHLATRYVAEHRADDVVPLVHDNIAFPTRLADALAGAGSRAFVNAGTAWQHVDGAGYRPKNLYAATKQAFEDVLAHYVERGRLDAVTLNIYDSYGPQDHRGKLLSALVRALDDDSVVEMSSGRQLVDLVHVDDIVGALTAASQQCGGTGSGSAVSRVHAISSGQPRTVREVVDLLGEVAGRPVPVRWGARPDREGEMLEHWAAGPPVPGWTPTIPLPTGLAELLKEAGAGR
ncbi:MAG: NAD(P)-dependent oxidoreductase [Acidimicrobiales bacterium]